MKSASSSPTKSAYTSAKKRGGFTNATTFPERSRRRIGPTGEGGRFVADGKTRPFEPDRPSTLRVELDAFDLLRVVPYSPVPLPVALQSGRLTLANTTTGGLARIDIPCAGLTP